MAYWSSEGERYDRIVGVLRMWRLCRSIFLIWGVGAGSGG